MVNVLNAVDDVVFDEITGKSILDFTLVCPMKIMSSINVGFYDVFMYNKTAQKVVLDSHVVEYMDGTKISFSDKTKFTMIDFGRK